MDQNKPEAPRQGSGPVDIPARGVPGRAVSALIDARRSLAPTAAGVFATLAAKTTIPFEVVMSDGRSYRSGTAPPAFTIRFRRRRAERAILWFGHVGLLESCFCGDIDLEGDAAMAFRAAFDAGYADHPTPLVRLRNARHEQRHSNRSHLQAKENARAHYGLGRAFYRPWLDSAMMYTCAYWREGTRNLDEAQRNKMDHVCRKVLLAAGETFVDVGCGWGGLLFHANEQFGAVGTGLNTTTEQVRELREEIDGRRLADRIRVVEGDFREPIGQFDKMFSIGTLEHAGRDQLDEVVAAHAALLKPGGLGVIHFIGHVGVTETEYFIREHVFPGGWIPSLAEAIIAMERHGLEVLDIENLRRHYALTLDAWASRFDAHWPEIHALDPQHFDERLHRIWRAYLWGCAEMFRSPNSRTHLFQVTVSKGNVGQRYPMSRSFLYAS